MKEHWMMDCGSLVVSSPLVTGGMHTPDEDGHSGWMEEEAPYFETKFERKLVERVEYNLCADRGYQVGLSVIHAALVGVQDSYEWRHGGPIIREN
jgi:hypothetical protein